MASQFDESDFIDSDFQPSQKTTALAQPAPASPTLLQRPPTREELELKVNDAQQKLLELKRAQEQLERERAALDEARRRRSEWQTGREEMLRHLTRGLGLLKEAEFDARRQAEQMSKTLQDLQTHLQNIQSVQENLWTQENWNLELTRALTLIENARMEWNSARLKWPLLDGDTSPSTQPRQNPPAQDWLDHRSFWQLCKVGFALTWPVLLATLAASTLLVVLWLQR